METQPVDEIPTKDHAEALLLNAARAYGIQARREQVHQAVSDAHHGTAFAEWAVLHLTPDTLVTPDELALYAALDKSGQVDRLASLHDLSEVRGVDEATIRSAVDELRRSTETIAKHTETLRQQQAALDRLVKKDADDGARRQQLEASQRRKLEMDRKRLATEVDGLSKSLEFRIDDLEQQAKEADPALTQTVDDLLLSDDKLLSSLQKLGWELDQQDPEEAQTVENLREICMRLIKTTVESVRTKLDTVYLDSLIAANPSRQVTDDEVKALEEEVESLYAEILPVAQMSVEQQHLEPALKAIHSRSGQSMDRSAVSVAYINKCLDYLLDRMERLQDRIEVYKSHQTAASSLATIAKTELATETTPPPKLTKAMPASPVRNLSPIRIGHGSRRRSSGIQDDPLESLLQTLAISLPAAESGYDETSIVALAKLVSQRSRKINDVQHDAQETFEATAAAQLDDARRALQLLQDTVLAESSFSEVKLVDPEIESSITFLANEVDKAKKKLAEDEQRRPGKSEKKAEFLKRWAH